jgi:hypothetical protein
MTTVVLYVLLFSTWGLGLLSWLAALSNTLAKWDLDRQEKSLDIEQKKLLLSKFSSITGARAPSLTSVAQMTEASKDAIPEKIKELMKSSPNHPEVEEIDGSDQILGVRFEAENYPPGFGDGDEE